MEDINLDFLTTPPRHGYHLERVPTPIAANRMDIVFGKKKSNKKKLEFAQKLAKVDELVKEIESFKLNNNELRKQLTDFQNAAQQVQHLYNAEKQQNEQMKKDFNQCKQQYDKIDTELANKTMQYVQLEARLADYEGRPIDYDNLVIKFIKIMKKLEGDDCLRYCQDKGLVEELTQYCINMKLKLPIVKSPQKLKSRSGKKKTQDVSVQCSNIEVHRESICKPEMTEQYTQSQFVDDDASLTILEKHSPIVRPILKEQYTQCQVARRDQASQYISTMITRQTNTEKVMQRHVSTMFPEPIPTPPINDILNEFCKWANIKSVTPFEDSPPRKHTNKTSKYINSTGTCTMLCNVRRKIDYLPTTTSAIKQELTTPSPSPIPTLNTTSAAASNDTRLNNNIPQTSASIHSKINNQNNLPNAILTLLNASTNSALGQLPVTAFNELWQIFGTMLLSLLKTSNAGISNINHNSINQQQFLDWLLELYISSQLPSNNTNTTSPPQQVNFTQTSPLRFNNSSVLSSSHIIRPQAMKSVNKGSLPSSINNIDVQSEISGVNRSYEPNTSTSSTPTYTTADIAENFSHNSNLMDIEIQQIQASTNTTEIPTDICESNVNQRKHKNKHKKEEQIAELFPEVKVNKNKSKVLKRLLNGKKKKKKTKRNKIDEFLINQETDEDQHIETAVDFLKIFAQGQESFKNNELNFKESEANEYEKKSTKNYLPDIEKPISYKESSTCTDRDHQFLKPLATSSNNDFTFIKPQNLQQSTKSIKDSNAQKLKNIPNRVENKYKILFGDSDSEIDDQEEISRLNKNSVINAIEIVANDIKNIDGNSKARNFEQPKKGEQLITGEQLMKGEQLNCVELTNAGGESNYFNFPISKSFTNVEQTCLKTNNNISIDNTTNQGDFSKPQLTTSFLENLENTSLFKNLGNNSQFSNTNDLFFDKMLQENQTKLNELIEQHAEIQPTTTEIISTNTYGNVATDIEKDLELSSDDEIMKNDLNECPNVLYSFNSLPNLPDTNRDYKQKTKTSAINTLCTNHNNLDVSHSIRSQSVINYNTTKIEIEPKEKHRLILEDNSINLKQTKSIETDKQEKSECRTVYEIYPSDFEKDFELSSDNESELTEWDNQFNNDNTLPANKKSIIKVSENRNNMKDFLKDLNNEGFSDIKQNHKSIVTQQDNQLSQNLNETYNVKAGTQSYFSLNDLQENYIPLTESQKTSSTNRSQNFKQLSSLNSIPARIEQNLREIDTLQNICRESPHIEKDFKEFEEQQNFKTEKYNSQKTEKELKSNEKLQNGFIRELKENQELKHKEYPNLPKSVDVIQNRENHIKLTHSTDSLSTLSDSNNTFIQKINHSNTEIFSELTKEPNLHNTDQLKISENKYTESTINLSGSVITVSEEKEDSHSFSATNVDKEISVVEISSDVTDLDNKRQLESPIEHDLIIDEDSNGPTNEEDELEINEDLNYQENINETSLEEDHNYNSTKQKKFKNEGLNDTKIDCEENKNAILNTSNTSLILDNTLYNEVLTDSIKSIVNDLLKDDDIFTTSCPDIKAKQDRKRKSECSLAEVIHGCKRSQRLKAKQTVLEQSINLSATPIKIGKYTQIQQIPTTVDKIKIKNSNLTKPKDGDKISKNKDFQTSLPLIQMGFFKERIADEDSNKVITSTRYNNEIKSPRKPHLNINTSGKLKNNFPSIQINVLTQDTVERNFEKGYDAKQNKIDVDYANTLMEYTEDTIISSQSLSESANQTLTSNQSSTPNENILNKAFYNYSESPKSPPPLIQNTDDTLNKTYIIPTERESEDITQEQEQQQQQDDTLFDTLINSYRMQHQQQSPRTNAFKKEQPILQKLEKELQLYCYDEMELEPNHIALKLINKLLQISDNYDLIQKALLKTAQNATPSKVPESELPSIIQEMPPRHLPRCLQRLFVLFKHFLYKNSNFCEELILKIESLLFDTQQAEKLPLEAALNLTQLYLLACKQQETLEIRKHPARIFMAKCLYYFNIKAKLLIHEVLLWYPTVLPHREDTSYDRSDALITVIQQLLMNTKYDMNSQEFRDKTLLSKLRYEYHFEPFKPSLDEVIANLMDKLNNSKFYNISLAFGLQCKRLEVKKVEQLFLQAHLLPLASQYYTKALNTLEYDKRIAVLLEIISIIVKAFPLHTKVDIYLNEFSKFFNGFDRPVIQEAALCSILRLQRFGCVNCYNLLRHFKPTYDLNPHTQAMLKTFLYRKSLKFWKTIKSQNPKN